MGKERETESDTERERQTDKQADIQAAKWSSAMGISVRVAM